MRNSLLGMGFASLVALAGASACGGHVVVDGDPLGSEGVGGAGAGAGPTWNTGAGAAPGGGGQAVSSSASGAAPAPSPDDDLLASCASFCAHFDRTACPDHGCYVHCADLLTVPRPCNPLTAPYFDCMSTGIHIPSTTRCEQIAEWLDPLFECLSSGASDCDPAFSAVCTERFDEHRACQRDHGQ